MLNRSRITSPLISTAHKWHFGYIEQSITLQHLHLPLSRHILAGVTYVETFSSPAKSVLLSQLTWFAYTSSTPTSSSTEHNPYGLVFFFLSFFQCLGPHLGTFSRSSSKYPILPQLSEIFFVPAWSFLICFFSKTSNSDKKDYWVIPSKLKKKKGR